MTCPTLPESVLLAAAAYRTWRLLSIDTILDRPRDWLLHGRPGLDAFVACPWCLGFWVSAAWWGFWAVDPELSLVATVPWAISAAVGLIARMDN